MSINRLSTWHVETYKTSNELNPSFMRNIFKVKETDVLTRKQCKLNLNFPSYIVTWLLVIRALVVSSDQKVGINVIIILNQALNLKAFKDAGLRLILKTESPSKKTKNFKIHDVIGWLINNWNIHVFQNCKKYRQSATKVLSVKRI